MSQSTVYTQTPETTTAPITGYVFGAEYMTALVNAIFFLEDQADWNRAQIRNLYTRTDCTQTERVTLKVNYLHNAAAYEAEAERIAAMSIFEFSAWCAVETETAVA